MLKSFSAIFVVLLLYSFTLKANEIKSVENHATNEQVNDQSIIGDEQAQYKIKINNILKNFANNDVNLAVLLLFITINDYFVVLNSNDNDNINIFSFSNNYMGEELNEKSWAKLLHQMAVNDGMRILFVEPSTLKAKQVLDFQEDKQKYFLVIANMEICGKYQNNHCNNYVNKEIVIATTQEWPVITQDYIGRPLMLIYTEPYEMVSKSGVKENLPFFLYIDIDTNFSDLFINSYYPFVKEYIQKYGIQTYVNFKNEYITTSIGNNVKDKNIDPSDLFIKFLIQNGFKDE